MNDRYLFKAKRIDNGEWIVGNLIQTPFMGTVRSWISSESEDKERLRSIATYKAEWRSIEVRTDSICQCTGLEDKNGTLIWENDVVFVTGYSYIEPEFKLNGKVTWSLGDSCFEIDGVPIVESKGSYLTEYHILGNIFDNPELLEVE